jgi:enamine deaminase RidA (YjgF/YER057c/UK114 family)
MAIERHDKSHRMSQAVMHGNTVYLAGQVADDPAADIKGQTQSVLSRIDALLVKAGTSKSNLLSAVIYLSDMRHFGAMNEVWDAWVDTGNPPARATVGALLARPEFLVEIMVVAAK